MQNSQVRFDLQRQLSSVLAAAGVDARHLLSSSALGATSPDSRSQSTEIMLLLRAAVPASGDPGLAISLGKRIDIARYGTFGFALMSCSNLGNAIKLMLRYGKLLGPGRGPDWSIRDQGDVAVLRAKQVYGNAAQRQLVAELCFSRLCAVGDFLVGGSQLPGALLQLDYPAPAHSKCYLAGFPVPVQFSASHCQLVLPKKMLDKPVVTASSTGHVVFLQQCEEMLAGLNRVENTTAAVRSLLMQSAGNFFDIAQIAQHLHVSERTLRRRLTAESRNFRSVCEEVKNLLAREYLTGTELSVADIAHLLGYTENVNFRRAFVRWNGVTPSVYRVKWGESE